jgi:hypothetical protein
VAIFTIALLDIIVQSLFWPCEKKQGKLMNREHKINTNQNVVIGKLGKLVHIYKTVLSTFTLFYKL